MRHIFLSHAGADVQAVRQFVEILRRNGLNVWFDKDNLQPGDPWMAKLEEAISDASAMIVYVGRLGIQTWVDREVRLGLVRNTHDREAFRLIPVLGEGTDLAKLPPFLQQQQYADLRDRQGAPDEIRRLVEILRNPSPSQAAVPAEYWTSHSPFRSLQVFGPEDSWLFFGRDRDIDELLTRLGRAPTLAVIGNSGSGKSSLIQAGLVPALRRGRFQHDGKSVDSWRIAVFRPSASPFDELAEALPRQLAPELSAADRAKFIDYSKEKLPAGGEALRTAIAAVISSTAQAAEVEASCAAEEETARQKAEEERSKRRRAYVLAAASCGVAVVLGLLAMFANAEKHNAQTALARSAAQEGTLRTSAPTSGWPAIRSEWIVDAK